MLDLEELTSVADESDFSGVAVVSRGDDRTAVIVSGLADRASRRAITVDTLFATASATKTFTALTAVSLVESGELGLPTTLRELVGDQLPHVDPTVTIEHLLGHTSGVGDYLDEEQLGDVDEHILGVSAHTLESPDDYLPLLAVHRQVSSPGERFAYNNSGFVMLSIAIERAGGKSFHGLVRERVFEPAGMQTAGFLRTDDLPEAAAIGYLENGRSNVFHLPVIGGGDGGAYLNVADMDAFWRSLFEGRIVSPAMLAMMTTPRSDLPGHDRAYGLGFWLRPSGDPVMLEGMDAGVSFRSAYDRPSGVGYTVVSNTSGGVWPLATCLDRQF